MIKRLFYTLTGGRPMRRINDGFDFVDVVSGINIDTYVDKNGRYWLAEGPWSLFRVKPTATSHRPYLAKANK